MSIAPVRLAGALVAVALGASGCLDGVYRCSSGGQCTNGQGVSGSCVQGFCAYADTSCPSGQRYGEYAGELAGECTTATVDAAGPDAADLPDGEPDATPCDPETPEICNGEDENCNDIIDDGFVLGMPCDGPDADVCEDGVTVCTMDGLGTECNDGPGDSPELCNGRDDNCDGATDEGFVLGTPCDGPDGDLCNEGMTVCDAPGTGTRCDDETGTISELCNGLDDDCDGANDNGFALGVGCDGPDTDFCEEGVTVCNGPGTGTTCNDATGNNAELCNGSDDNCNGTTDEGFALGLVCDGPDGDLCAEGMTVCNGPGTGTVCDDATPTNPELCNGMDDNCNTLIDEGYNVGDACDGNDTDACFEGVLACNGPGTGTTCTDMTGSTVETCNGLDDDCRNGVDDPWPLKGSACSEGIGACLRTGVYVCLADGTGLDCSATPGMAGREFCGDGIDSDCLGDVDPVCPPNDLRSGATVISASGTFTADLRYANDNVAPTCAGTGGRDVFYQFTLGGPQVIYADTFGSDFDTVLRLENGTCAAMAAQSQCVNDSCAQTRSQLVVSLAAGTYCLAVDQASSAVTAGALTLSFTFGGRAPAGTLAVGSGLTVSGNTCGDPDASDSSGCALMSDVVPDEAFYFTLCPSTTRTLSANTCDPMTVYDTLIYVRVGNGVNGTEVACNDDITPQCMIGNPFASQLTGVSVVGPGLFWLIVDGFPTPPPGANCGGYRVNYSLL